MRLEELTAAARLYIKKIHQGGWSIEERIDALENIGSMADQIIEVLKEEQESDDADK